MQNDTQERRPGELVFNAVLLIFSLFMFWHAYRIAGFSSLSSAGAFPMAMSALMAVTSSTVLLRTWRRRAARGGLQAFWVQILPQVAVVFSVFILGYSLLLKPLGFVVASFLFLLVSTWFLEGGRFKRSLLLSVVSIVAVYIVFRLVFQVVLPEGIIPERSIMAAIRDLFAGGN